MDKKPFTLLRFDKSTAPKKREKEPLVDKKWLLHLQNETCKINRFASSYDHAEIVFSSGEHQIAFVVDYMVDTILLDFDGTGMPENVRIQASKLLEKMVESLRFRYKEHYWWLSRYYIADVSAYEERKNPLYPTQFQEDWIRIARMAKREMMDDADRLFMEVEEVHDLQLTIVGEDGKILCDYLKKLDLITYETTEENEYTLEFPDPSSDELKNINRKIVFAREVVDFGYNIWTDYAED